MKQIPFFVFALFLGSCIGQNNSNIKFQSVAIGNGQPEPKRIPVYRFLSVKLVSQQNADLQVSDYIRTMLQDKAGNIWFGTNNDGVCRYNGKQFVYFGTKEGISGNAVRKIVEDKEGNIWMATNNGLTMYNGKTFTLFTEKDGLPSNDTWTLLCDSKGQLWVSTMKGVCRYNGSSFTAVDLPLATTTNREFRFTPKLVWSMYEDKSGAIWFGTDGNGVKKFDGTTFTNYTVANGLAGNNVLSITQDKAGNLWFGTWGHGLSQYNTDGFVNYTDKNGLASNDVWTMLVDKQGYLWMGTLGGGVSKFNGTTFTTYTENEGRTKNHVQSILQDKNGEMWFGFSGGVFRLNDITLINFIKEGC